MQIQTVQELREIVAPIVPEIVGRYGHAVMTKHLPRRMTTEELVSALQKYADKRIGVGRVVVQSRGDLDVEIAFPSSANMEGIRIETFGSGEEGNVVKITFGGKDTSEPLSLQGKQVRDGHGNEQTLIRLPREYEEF